MTSLALDGFGAVSEFRSTVWVIWAIDSMSFVRRTFYTVARLYGQR
jgi:hypothetical protein